MTLSALSTRAWRRLTYGAALGLGYAALCFNLGMGVAAALLRDWGGVRWALWQALLAAASTYVIICVNAIGAHWEAAAAAQQATAEAMLRRVLSAEGMVVQVTHEADDVHARKH